MKYEGFIGKPPIGISQLFPYSFCIFKIEYGIDDYAISAFHKEFGVYSSFRKTKIHYQGERAYISRWGRRYYLDNVSLVNSPWCNAEVCRKIERKEKW